MGLFSVRRRLPQPAAPTFRTRLARAAGTVVRNTGREVAAWLGTARLAAIAATNDARIVAILLLLAAVTLGLEMAASFHVI
jgi:hypothetical protein